MPNRFPTEAANAPFLGEDPDGPGKGREPAAGDKGSARGDRSDPSLEDEAKPGKGENQAGFLKDTD